MLAQVIIGAVVGAGVVVFATQHNLTEQERGPSGDDPLHKITEAFHFKFIELRGHEKLLQVYREVVVPGAVVGLGIVVGASVEVIGGVVVGMRQHTR